MPWLLPLTMAWPGQHHLVDLFQLLAVTLANYCAPIHPSLCCNSVLFLKLPPISGSSPGKKLLTTVLALLPVFSLSLSLRFRRPKLDYDWSTRELLLVNRAHLKVSPEKEKVWVYSKMINHFIHAISNKIQGFKKKVSTLSLLIVTIFNTP